MPHSDETGKRVFEDRGQINWAVVNLVIYEPETIIGQPVIVRVFAQSRAVAFVYCDRAAIINNVSAVAGYKTHMSKKLDRNLTITRETFGSMLCPNKKNPACW